MLGVVTLRVVTHDTPRGICSVSPWKLSADQPLIADGRTSAVATEKS
jgi:hypothetical protein